MKPLNGEPGEPTPEQLAAYADGELDDNPGLAALRSRIEARLEHDPDARAEVDAHQCLARMWEETRPTEPDGDVWDRMLPRLEGRVLGRTARPARPFAWLTAAVTAGVAAACLLVALLGRESPEVAHNDAAQQAPDAPRIEGGEPLLVVSADEIEILSVYGPEAAVPAVGRLPVEGPLELVAPGEVELQRLEPEVRMGEGGAPVIWAPLRKEDNKE